MSESKYEQMEIDLEIVAELATDGVAEQSAEKDGGADKGEKNPSRKPFVLHDFDVPKDREMAVFTNAKKLSEYVFVVTEKSPKKLRWSIVTRLQNATVDVVENLYRANFEKGAERIAYQKTASVALHLVDFFAQTALAKGAISMKQCRVIGKQIEQCKKLLNGWVRATKEGG